MFNQFKRNINWTKLSNSCKFVIRTSKKMIPCMGIIFFYILLADGVLRLVIFFWASGNDMSGFWLGGEVIASAFVRRSIKRIPQSFPKVQMITCLLLQKEKRKDVLWHQTPEASDSFLIALQILLVQVCATSFQMFSSHGGEGAFNTDRAVTNFHISHPCISQLCGYLYIYTLSAVSSLIS